MGGTGWYLPGSSASTAPGVASRSRLPTRISYCGRMPWMSAKPGRAPCETITSSFNSGAAATTCGSLLRRASSGCHWRMPSASMRISCTCAVVSSRRFLMSRCMPLVMASAMISAATPAATPATEMDVTTPTTACRRLALRYRAATKSSKRIAVTLRPRRTNQQRSCPGQHCRAGRKHAP